jgi:ATP-dependent helicase HrpB
LKSSLPIDSILAELNQALSRDNNVILSAQPGAGKTTRVPLALLDADWLKDPETKDAKNKSTGSKKILMLEPRRLAARNAAVFMAKSLGEAVGQTVGYRMRQDSRVSKNTRIEVITEGILTRLLLQDPELSDVGLIIFDEHHERSINTDLGLALSLQCQQLFRDDLKLLVMSATLDKDALEDMLGAKTLFCPGRSFPIEYHYLGFDAKKRLNTQMTSAILKALSEESGSILAFLPGVRDILQVQQDLQQALQTDSALQTVANSISIHPLYGQLSDKEQQLAIQPAEVNYDKHHRKIVLATNIAESSLTIEGIRIVVDSGLEKQLTYNARSIMNYLMTKKISQASATQRAGRAGRMESGVAYRLWSEQQHNSLEAHSPAEISRIELSDLVLNVAQWGAEVDDLDWLTTPPKRAIQQAQILLSELELLNDSGQITQHGEQASQLGLSPRFAHMLLLAASNGEASNSTLKDASLLAALLSDTPKALRNNDDLSSLLQLAYAQANSFKTLHRQADSWVSKVRAADSSIIHPQDFPIVQPTLSQLLALAFPDRLAKKRSNQNLNSQNNQFLLSSGRGAKLHPSSSLNRFDWLIVTDIEDDQQGGSIIRKAMAIDESELLQAMDSRIQQKNHIQWNDKGQLEAELQSLLGAIILQRKKITNLSPDDWQDAWYNYFIDNGINHNNNSKLSWTPECLQLQARLQLAHQHFSSEQSTSVWPDFSDEALLSDINNWLLPLLTDIRSEKALKNVDLKQALTNRLGWEKMAELKELIPEKIQVPSGSYYAIDYLKEHPVLAVKLQEMFGYQGNPSILNGKVKLMIHLLSPARRPLQITQDLPHFWAHSYFEVRKDMRGRYPKHNWPENPMESEATRFTKHKKKH